MIDEIRRKISWINFATIVLMILISFSVIWGIIIFGNESINVQNSILVSLNQDLQNADNEIKKLETERANLFKYYFTQAQIDDRVIDEYIFEEARSLKKDRRFVNKKSVNDIVSDPKLYELFNVDYGSMYHVGFQYSQIEERIREWNTAEISKYGEYFNKGFADLKFISTKFNERYDEKDPQWYQKGNVGTIFQVFYYIDELKPETLTEAMKDFNKVVEAAIDKINGTTEAINISKSELKLKIEREVARLEQPNIYVYGILISKLIIVIFLLFLVQIFLSTFRYLIQTKGRYENQLLLLRYLELKPKERVEVLGFLVSEKVPMDAAPEPLLKELLARLGKA